MSKPKVQVIHDETWDWEILVFDGKKVAENHSLSIHDWQELFDRLEIDFEIKEVKDITRSKFYPR